MTDSTTTHAADRRALPDGLFAAIPIVLVNTLAVVGQMQWAGTHLHWGIMGRLLFAGALETVALAVTYYAHRSLLEGDSAVRLRLGAYVIATGAATINYQEHSAPHWGFTPNAAVFAGASLLSPILWTTYSRFASRAVMRAAGLIDRRAAKFSLARWALFPVRTFAAFRYSVWESVQSPAAAIAGSEAQRNGRPVLATVPEPEPAGELASEPEPVSEPVTDASLLLHAEPPAWSSLTVQEASERAAAILPKRSARELAEALNEVGVTLATAANVRQALRRARERTDSGDQLDNAGDATVIQLPHQQAGALGA